MQHYNNMFYTSPLKDDHWCDFGVYHPIYAFTAISGIHKQSLVLLLRVEDV